MSLVHSKTLYPVHSFHDTIYEGITHAVGRACVDNSWRWCKQRECRRIVVLGARACFTWVSTQGHSRETCAQEEYP